MIKTAIIPLAGKGVRLGNIGLAMAKALIPYQKHPAIDYIFEMLQTVNIEQVILIVGWKKEGIISYLEDGSSFNMDIAYVIQPEPKGIADAILRAEPFLKDKEFLVVLGDTLLFPKDSLKILDGANQVMATKVEDPTKHGMVEYKFLCKIEYEKLSPIHNYKGSVKQIVEKPVAWDLRKSNLGICGAYCFNHKIFDAIEDITPNEKTTELEMSDAINKLIELDEEVTVKVFEGTYVDMGRLIK